MNKLLAFFCRHPAHKLTHIETYRATPREPAGMWEVFDVMIYKLENTLGKWKCACGKTVVKTMPTRRAKTFSEWL